MKSIWFWLAFNAALMAFMFLGLRVLNEGPTLSHTDFNADRAFDTLQALNPDNLPHPAGSAENIRVRERIEERLRSFGYQIELQKADYCTPTWPGCTAIENIVAIKRGGSESGDAILLTSHYDSAPVAPGAGDDLAGVSAMLEIARVTADKSYVNDVIFLFADGEETGLRGAMAFAEQHPSMARVKLALNVEARGVAGPSAMFETSDDNSRLIEIFAKSARRPIANSLMFEVYRKMPNNTDLTVYKKAGAPGLNFAFSRGVSLYHSSLDDIAHLSRRSLAHHGDNLLTALDRAASLPLSSLEADGNATYVDLFGLTLLHWPSSLNMPVSILCLVLLLIIGAKTHAFGTKPLLFAGAGAIAMFAGLILTGWLLSFPLGIWPAIHPLDHPYPWPARVALTSASILVAFIAGATLYRRAGPNAALFVNWLLLALVAVYLAVFLPGGAYMTLLPVVLFSVIGFVESYINNGKTPVIAASIGLAAAAYMAVYHFVFFDVVLNYQVSYLKTPILALFALTAAPLAAVWRKETCSFWRPAALISIITIVASGAAMAVPAYTPDRPRSVNVAYFQEIGPGGEQDARWRVFTYGPADKAYVKEAGFLTEISTFKRFGARESNAYFQPAQVHDLKTPQLQVFSEEATDGGRIIKGEISAGRAGPFFGVTFAADAPATEFSVNGITLIDSKKFASGKISSMHFNGFNDRPLAFELHVSGEAPIDVMLFEVSDLPDDAVGQSIIAKRPKNAAPIQFGDHTEIQKHYRL